MTTQEPIRPIGTPRLGLDRVFTVARREFLCRHRFQRDGGGSVCLAVFGQVTLKPPSTSRIVPVTHPARSDASHAIARRASRTA